MHKRPLCDDEIHIPERPSSSQTRRLRRATAGKKAGKIRAEAGHPRRRLPDAALDGLGRANPQNLQPDKRSDVYGHEPAWPEGREMERDSAASKPFSPGAAADRDGGWRRPASVARWSRKTARGSNIMKPLTLTPALTPTSSMNLPRSLRTWRGPPGGIGLIRRMSSAMPNWNAERCPDLTIPRCSMPGTRC
jgi:hypothetical protein